MAGARALPDFVREKGASRGYINTKTGERLSRRQYDKRVAEAALRKSLSAERKSRQDKSQRLTNALLEAYVRQERSKGRKLTKIDARKSAEFKRITGAFRKPRLSKAQQEDNETLIDLLNERRDNMRAAIEALGGRAEFEKLYDNAMVNSMGR